MSAKASTKKAPKKGKPEKKKVAKKAVKKTAAASKKKTAKKKAVKSTKKAKVSQKTKAAKKKTATSKTGKKTARKVAKKPAASKISAGKKKVAKKKVARKKKVGAAGRSRRRRYATFRKSLLSKQQELMKNYDAYKGETGAQGDDGTEDYIDYAVSSYAKEFMLSLTELDRKQLRLVEEALRRIDIGEYGLCQQCGVDIPEPRLEVHPWARHCVRCQELEDKGLLPTDYHSRGMAADEEDQVRNEDPEYEEPLEGESEEVVVDKAAAPVSDDFSGEEDDR